jgi:hypothetical protein
MSKILISASSQTVISIIMSPVYLYTKNINHLFYASNFMALYIIRALHVVTYTKYLYYYNLMGPPSYRGTAVAQWLRCCATNRKVSGSIPAGVSGFFIDLKSFRSHYGPGVDSASNRNEYQEYFLGVKTAGA